MKQLIGLIITYFTATSAIWAEGHQSKTEDKSALAAASAADVIARFSASMKSGKFGDTIALLPDSYQKDLDGLVSQFGESIDPALWESTLAIGRKMSALLKKKKAILTKSQLFEGLKFRDGLIENYDQIVEHADALFHSDSITLEGLKKGNISALLDGPASEFAAVALKSLNREAGAALDRWANMHVKVVGVDRDSVRVLLTSHGERVPLTLVKVEGKWIPAGMADSWSEFVEETARGIAEATSPKNLSTIMSLKIQIHLIDEVYLNFIEKAESPDQIDEFGAQWNRSWVAEFFGWAP